MCCETVVGKKIPIRNFSSRKIWRQKFAATSSASHPTWPTPETVFGEVFKMRNAAGTGKTIPPPEKD
jgi:hypothetical protein